MAVDVRDYLRPVKSIEDIRRNIVEFNSDLEYHLQRATSICGKTWHWIYDPESEDIGPSKFVGFKDMTFERYEALKAADDGSQGFQGSTARGNLEVLLGRLRRDSDTQAKLIEWMQSRFSKDRIRGWAPSKWFFLSLPEKASKRAAEDSGEFAASKRAAEAASRPRIPAIKDEIDAIDRHAMALAKAYYRSKDYRVKDHSKKRSYDLYCTKNQEKLFVEVKGTTGSECSFFLTCKEAELSRIDPSVMALFFVRNIALDKGERPVARDGDWIVRHPWDVADEKAVSMRALQYRCELLD